MGEGDWRTHMNKPLNTILHLNQHTTLCLYPDNLRSLQNGADRICFFKVGDILTFSRTNGFPLQRDYVTG